MKFENVGFYFFVSSAILGIIACLSAVVVVFLDPQMMTLLGK